MLIQLSHLQQLMLFLGNTAIRKRSTKISSDSQSNYNGWYKECENTREPACLRLQLLHEGGKPVPQHDGSPRDGTNVELLAGVTTVVVDEVQQLVGHEEGLNTILSSLLLLLLLLLLQSAASSRAGFSGRGATAEWSPEAMLWCGSEI